ncbi:MAG: hypothetical protein ACR2H3_16650 [Acidimicrobiales bacterium]
MLRVAVSPEGDGWVVAVRATLAEKGGLRPAAQVFRKRWEVAVADGAGELIELRRFRLQAQAIAWASDRASEIENPLA